MWDLLAEWRPTALQMAIRILGDSDDAQDVCQNALIELTHRLAELREAAALPGFLRQIVLHQAFDFRRRRATRRSPGSTWDEANIAAEEDEVEQRVAVWDALQKLPESERETILLDLMDGYQHSEIARGLGVSVPAVRARLQSAKRRLRDELKSLHQDSPMSVEPIVQQLVDRAFPGAFIESAQPEPEAWLPYAYRLKLRGRAEPLVVRKDVDAKMAPLLPALLEAGLPAPRLVGAPTSVLGTPWSLWEEPRGENVTLWTMDGTYHRFRTAADLALEAQDQLQSFTHAARGLGVAEVTLKNRFEELSSYDGPWAQDATFAAALARLHPLVERAEAPLVYSHYLHFFPNWLRVQDGRLGEIVYPFGELADPLLGLAMVWIYDCYPFVHTGFVEQYLIRHNVPRGDFAIRLAVQTLAILSKETQVSPSKEGETYRDALLALLDRAWSWLR